MLTDCPAAMRRSFSMLVDSVSRTPAKNSATPKWANSMPAISKVNLLPFGRLRQRRTANAAVPRPTQQATNTPRTALIGISGDSNATRMADAMATATAGNRRLAARRRFPDAQSSIGPNGSNRAIGASSTANKVPKYGGPTEIRPKPKASPISGYMVPSSTMPAAHTNTTLLASSRVSRDAGANGLPPDIVEPRSMYSSNDPP